MKKLFAIILAVLMCMALVVPAFSAEEVNPVITVPVNLTNTGNTAAPASEFTFTLAGTPLPNNQDKYTVSIAETAAGAVTTANVEVDFSEVVFPGPGTYEYTLTEGELPAHFSLKDDETDTRKILVYVGYADNKATELSILSAFMYKEDPKDTDTEKQKKNGGFENEYKYNTYDLELAKTVTGNQGEHDKHFEFTVVIDVPEGVEDGTYTIETNCECEDEEWENPKEITVEGGKATVTVYLKHGETFKIIGLPEGSNYTITEKEETGYTTTVNEEENNEVSGKLTETTTITYVNDKTGEIPTGILLTIAPFVALMLIGVAGVLFVVLKKKRNN